MPENADIEESIQNSLVDQRENRDDNCLYMCKNGIGVILVCFIIVVIVLLFL